MAATVTINVQEFDVYADETAATNYLEGSISEAAEAFRDAEDDIQKRALVSATRWLDDQAWKEDYDTFAERAAVTDIVNASIELAAMLVDDPELRTTIEETDTKRLKAGSVELEYFRGTSVETATVFPKRVMSLVRDYLAGTGFGYGGTSSYGTDRTSSFDDYGFNEGL